MKKKSIKISKKKFIKQCKALYDDAKESEAGLIHLHLMIDEDLQGKSIIYTKL